MLPFNTETTYDALKTQADTKLNSVVGGLVPAAKVPDTISEIRTVQSASDVTNAVYSVLADSKSNSDAQNYVDRIYRGRNVDNTHTVGVVDGRFKTMIDANIAYDTLKYLRNGVTLENVTSKTSVTDFVNALDGTDTEKSSAISDAIESGLNGFLAKDIADIINRVS